MIVYNIDPASEETFRDDLWRRLRSLTPPETIYLSWAGRPGLVLTVREDPEELTVVKKGGDILPADLNNLRLHLVSVHCNGAGLSFSAVDAQEYHHDEHHGPCGLRDHPETDWVWDAAKVSQVLGEGAEL